MKKTPPNGVFLRTFATEIKNQNKSVMSNQNNNINRETWGKIIQIAITILTVISGMFFEAKAQAMTNLLAMI